MISSLGIFDSVQVITRDELQLLSGLIVMPDEDVSHAVAERYLSDRVVTFDSSWKLRWDLDAATHHIEPEGVVMVSEDALDQLIMNVATRAAARSPDWWRQVGGVLARDGEVLFTAYNTHKPSDQSAYAYGDPRSNFGPGQNIDMSLALHAEVGLITHAAREGVSTKGCDLYVTTFPCPPCANAVANSGIKRLFYRDGYSLVAGADSLRNEGVEIIRVR
jgi:dCMP deaminase